MVKTQCNQRRHLRYRTSDRQVYQLWREDERDRAELVQALVVDESHSGFGCVIVGPPPGRETGFYHQENEKIRVPLILRKHRELQDGIQFLGFERADGVMRIDE
jgi:hypothetical protein